MRPPATSFTAVPSVILFFSYNSVFADKHYYTDDPEMLALVAGLADDPALAPLEASLQEECGISFFRELVDQSAVSNPLASRRVQSYLFIAIAHLVRRRLGAQVKGVAGYSSGMSGAMIASGATDIRTYCGVARPVFDQIFREMLRSYAKMGLESVFVDFGDVGLDHDRLLSLMASISDALSVKDIRSPTFVELIGPRNALRTLLDRLRESAGPGLRIGTPVRDTFNHTPLIQPERFRQAIAGPEFNPPDVPLFSACGRSCPANAPTGEVGALYHSGVLRPFNMSSCARSIRETGAPCVVVGSENAARFIFTGLGEYEPDHKLLTAAMLS